MNANTHTAPSASTASISLKPTPSDPMRTAPAPRASDEASSPATTLRPRARFAPSQSPTLPRPTGAFVAASWAAMMVGAGVYLIGLWNAQLQLNEKGYYLTLLLFGLFSAVSLQKSVRDRLEGIRVTGLYYGLCWVSVGAAILLLIVGLWNAQLAASEKGFYAMSYALALFGAIAVQKNVRDFSLLSDAESTSAD